MNNWSQGMAILINTRFSALQRGGIAARRQRNRFTGLHTTGL